LLWIQVRYVLLKKEIELRMVVRRIWTVLESEYVSWLFLHSFLFWCFRDSGMIVDIQNRVDLADELHSNVDGSFCNSATELKTDQYKSISHVLRSLPSCLP